MLFHGSLSSAARRGITRPAVLLAAAAGVLLQAVPASCAEFMVRDGRPLAEIIIAESPRRSVKVAAGELQHYVEKISGARLAVTNAASGTVPVCVYIGQSRHTDSLKISADGLENGAFKIIPGDGSLTLLGRDDDFVPPEPYAHDRADIPRKLKKWDELTGEKWGNPIDQYFNLFKQYNRSVDLWQLDGCGSLNAVHELLRDLGVRWYMPGELGEYVPKMKDVPLPETARTVHPDFAVRDLHQGIRQFWVAERDEVMWQLRLGMNMGFDLIGPKGHGHGMVPVHSREEVKSAHPEYYAIWGGKRMTASEGKPCLSSTGLFGQHVKYARAVFDIYNLRMVSISPADGYATLCQCELCRDKGSPGRLYSGQMSDYAWGYMDQVAREVNKTHPDRRVSGLVYSTYRLPPDSIDQMSPNLALYFCQCRANSFDEPEARRDELELRKAWLKKLPSKEVYVYDYYLHATPGRPTEGVPAYFPRIIAEDLRSLKGVSRGEFVEVHRSLDESGYHTLAANHLNLYVTSRLYWNADQDLEAILEEYYDKFYGPAAKEMKAFVEYAEANWKKASRDVTVIDRLIALLEAARKAAGDTVYGKRVEILHNFTRPMRERRTQLELGRKDMPRFRANVCSKSDFKLDGRLDEPIWDKYKIIIPLRELKTGGKPQNETYFRALWADDSLYFGILCLDDDAKNLNIATTRSEDANIWRGDFVEIMLETHSHSFYQFTANPAGALTDTDRKNGAVNTSWNSGAECAAFAGSNFWSLEARVPIAGEGQEELDALNGVSGRRPSETYPWFFNLCRQRTRTNATERSAFSPTGTDSFQDVLKFGELTVK